METIQKPKKRGRKSENEYLCFEYLYNNDVEKSIINFTKNKETDDIFNSFVLNLTNFYHNIILKKKKICDEKSDIKNIILLYLKQYNYLKELNAFFYLKRNLEIYYNFYNKNRYFDKQEEYAFRLYLKEQDDIKKEFIYKKFLKFPFEKLAENIINKYELYSDKLSYNEIHTMALSHVHEQLRKFDVTRNTKAYSYYGTTIKHFCIGILKKEKKVRDKIESFEEYHSDDDEINDKYGFFENNLYEKNINLIYFSQIIDLVIKPILKINTNEDERKVGYALIEILDNWENIFIFDNNTATYKYERSHFLQMMRNLTNFNTGKIRYIMNKYIKKYREEKLKVIKDEYNKYDI